MPTRFRLAAVITDVTLDHCSHASCSGADGSCTPGRIGHDSEWLSSRVINVARLNVLCVFCTRPRRRQAQVPAWPSAPKDRPAAEPCGRGAPPESPGNSAEQAARAATSPHNHGSPPGLLFRRAPRPPPSDFTTGYHECRSRYTGHAVSMRGHPFGVRPRHSRQLLRFRETCGTLALSRS